MNYLVKDLMSEDIATIDVEASVADASQMIAENPRGYAIALKKGRPVGMVTERDLVRKVLAKGVDPSQIEVSQVMSTPLVIIGPDEGLTEAADTMKENNVRKLPVVREGILYGVITARDIVEHFTEYVDKSIREILVWTPLNLA